MSKCNKFDQAIPFYSSIDADFKSRFTPSWHNKNTWDFSLTRVNTPHELGVKVSAAGWTAAYFSDKIKANEDKNEARNKDIGAFIELLKNNGFDYDAKEQKYTRSKDRLTLKKKTNLTFIVTAPQKNQKDLCILLEELFLELYGAKEATMPPAPCKTTKMYEPHGPMENKDYGGPIENFKVEKNNQLQQTSNTIIELGNKICCISSKDTTSTFQMTPEAFNCFGNTEITGFEKKRIHVKEVASWAVWNAPSDGNYKSISGMKLRGMFSTNIEKVLPQLNPNIVLLGLNCSQNPCDTDGAWQNFHLREQDNENKLTTTNRPGQWLRYACRNTMFWGVYMTDLFKSLTDPNSGKVVDYFRRNPNSLQLAAESFAEEMKALRTLSTDREQPLVFICLGTAVYDYMTKGYKKGTNIFINSLNKQLPGIKLVIGFANHYSYPVRCGFTDEQSMNIYLKHFQEVQQIIEQSIHGNNGVTIADKPTKIIKLK